ncbi:histidine kinase [Bifidobacterium sp. ESL0764]|uniref:sensor histidine kinase n=1 Tax=Bifidobacterium sp. ESL0764 TaxID=2983228 RepID=UPI0023FA195D|nr:histidine kinase [Bifidobacterium sp. ESL0764]WEV65263.1 histidine kinase [Bifidobacterium sp. ESL0764]
MTTLRRFGAWLARNQMAGDALLALVALFFALISTTTDEGGLWVSYSEGWQFAWSCALIVPVIFRRRYPQVAALAFAGLAVLQLLCGPGYVFGDTLAVVMLYSVIVYGDPSHSKAFIVLAFIVGGAAAPIITWGMEIGPVHNPHQAGDTASYTYYSCQSVYTSGFNATCSRNLAGTVFFMLVGIVTMLAAACFMGYWSRTRLDNARLLRERNIALAARGQEDLDIARTAERARIARDMHDVVAHTLSTIIVQSDGGRYAGAHDPAKARAIMETIRHESHKAQRDMSDLLSTFGGAPHLGYADIAALAAQADATAHATGGSVKRIVEGEAKPQLLGGKAQSAIYHAVQEALTNARKYAGKGVEVTVREIWDDTTLRLAIEDNGNGAAAAMDGHRPGIGLTGMRERVEAAGGRMQAGPRIGGGFAVEVRIALGGSGGSHRNSDKNANHHDSEDDNGNRHQNLDAIERRATENADAFPYENTDTPVSSPDVTDQTGRYTQSTNSTASLPRPSSDARYPELIEDEPDPESRHASIFQRFSSLSRRLYSADEPRNGSGTGNGATEHADLNWVERISRFFAHHYLLADIILAAVLLLLAAPSGLITFRYGGANVGYTMVFGTTERASTPQLQIVDFAIDLAGFTALALRRRLPQCAAALMVAAAMVSLIFCADIPVVVLYAPISLYSVCLYGKGHSRRWAGLAAVVGSAVFGIRFSGSFVGYPTLVDWVTNRQRYAVYGNRGSYPFEIAMFVIIALAICAMAITAALWTRASGTNMMVLEARHQALEAESKRKQIAAANHERERIGAQIRGEVSETLTGVIDKADAGIAMLDRDAAAGVSTSPQAIIEAFRSIGEQGRESLAHMRSLLRVLRETGGSDDNPAASQPLLHPVAVTAPERMTSEGHSTDADR